MTFYANQEQHCHPSNLQVLKCELRSVCEYEDVKHHISIVLLLLLCHNPVKLLSCAKKGQKKVKVLPLPMAHRAELISASVALGHASANAVKATGRGAGPLVAPCV